MYIGVTPSQPPLKLMSTLCFINISPMSLINQHGGSLNQTPIYYACLNGHTNIVQILLDNNCDIHDAINGACEGGYTDIVEILMKHNVDS
jgi:hypothetical protein